MRQRLISLFVWSLAVQFVYAARSIDVDILIVGGGTSGVAAGIQASRMGAKTLIIEETPWLGGMLTAAGVSAVDGNYNLRSGIWGEFLDSLVCRYGSEEALKSGWVSNVLFSPAVGNDIFQTIVAKGPNLTVWQESSLVSLKRKKNTWFATIKRTPSIITKLTLNGCGETTPPEGGWGVSARIVIDATELGDVAAMLDVPFDVGMESRELTGEDIAPEQANGIIQDLTYVATLKDYGRDVMPTEAPDGYTPDEFACCCANPLCINPKEPDRVWSPDMMLSYGRLPNGEYMLNWPICGNDSYLNIISLSPSERQEALQKAKNRTLRFIYFIQKELGYTHLGLADDQYPTTDCLPLIPYHRESRRIHGIVRFTLNDIAHPYNQQYPLYRTGIAVGDYPVDHHHTRYEGTEPLPDLHFYKVPSFCVPLGCLIPERQDGLIVAEKSISVSNLANGTTRLQPIVMQIGQAAGIIAALSVKENLKPRDVSVRRVQDEILSAGGYLLPLLDVDKNDSVFKPLQRIAATGLLKAEPRSVGWKNEMWLNIDNPLTDDDVATISRFYPDFFNAQRPLTMTKGQTALLLDTIYDPFHTLKIDIHGDFVTQ